MPKKISEQELEAIAAIVANYPNGVQVGIIRDRLKFDLPPRMLQRRLSLLAEQGRIVVSGTGKGSRYRLPEVTHHIKIADRAYGSDEVKVEAYVTLSPEGESIKDAVRSLILLI